MKLRQFFIGIALLAFIIFIFLNTNQLAGAFKLIRQVRWPVLLLILPLQYLSFYCSAKYYQTMLAGFNYKLRLRPLYEIVLALNFVNNILPSAGASGATYLRYAFKKRIPTGTISLAFVGRYILTYLSFAALLLAALLFLYFGGGIGLITVRLMVLVVFAAIAISALIFYIFTQPDKFNALVEWAQRAVDWASHHIFKRPHPLIGKARVRRLLVDFHNSYEVLLKNKNKLRKPTLYTLGGNIVEVATLYIVFIALGSWVNPGAVIISYAAANLVGALSIIPGDVGVYELTIIAALGATGVAAAVAFSATLLYRVLIKLIFLPIGFYFYTKHLKDSADGNLKR